MNKLILLTSFLILIFTGLSLIQAQEIIVEKVSGGYKFVHMDKQLKMKDLVSVVSVNPEAAVYAEKAKSGYALSSGIAFVGGFMIGWPIGQAISGRDVNWTIAAAGAGLVIIGIPVSSTAVKNAKEAVSIYNNSLGNDDFGYEIPKASIIINSTGVGISVKF